MRGMWKAGKQIPKAPATALILLWSAFAIQSATFVTSNTVYSILQGFAFIGLLTAGLAVTMIAGELDLSVASAAAVAGIVAIQLSEHGVWFGIIAATLLAAAFGTFQGACIGWLRINSLVFTIGSFFVLRGVAHLLTDGGSVLLQLDKASQSDLLIRRFWIFSPLSLITVTLIILLGMFLAWNRWGREIYSVGGGRPESAASGVAQVRPLVVAFGISGAAAGLAGALSSVVAGSGSAQAFTDVLLLAITAALVGGISLRGGKGTMLNVVLGGLLLQTLVVGLYHNAVSLSVQNLVTGALLVGILLLSLDWSRTSRSKVTVGSRRKVNGKASLPRGT